MYKPRGILYYATSGYYVNGWNGQGTYQSKDSWNYKTFLGLTPSVRQEDLRSDGLDLKSASLKQGAHPKPSCYFNVASSLVHSRCFRSSNYAPRAKPNISLSPTNNDGCFVGWMVTQKEAHAKPTTFFHLLYLSRFLLDTTLSLASLTYVDS